MIMRAGLISLILVITTITFCWAIQKPTWRGITEEVGNEAIKRTYKLKAGMPEVEVFKVLGLQKFGLKAQSDGSGSMRAWPTWYPVTRNRAILIRWNLTKTPPTMVSVSVMGFNRQEQSRS